MLKLRTSPLPPSIPGAKWIPLTKGLFALVDDADYELVNAYNWNVTAKSRSGNLYVERRAGGRLLSLHRWLMNAPKGTQVDHINGNGLDCRRANMRVCSVKENHWNVRKQNRATSSRFKGVTWDKNRNLWMAKIKHNGKHKYLGRFSEQELAARAYNRAAEELFGAFALPNTL